MKKHFIILSAILLTISFTNYSCKKNNDGCDGGNLCFTINGVDVTVTAERINLPNNRYRIYWEEGSGNNYKNIEIDIYGNTVAEYNITDNAGTAGDAGFQYFINDNGSSTNYQGTSGTLNLTSVDNDEWSGTFSGTVTDGSSSFSLEDGKFSGVPLQ